MSVFSPIKRLIVYGGLSLVLASPIIYKIGYYKGALDKSIDYNNKPMFEEINDDKYLITRPKSSQKYVLDFESMKITKFMFNSAGEQKKLEAILLE